MGPQLSVTSRHRITVVGDSIDPRLDVYTKSSI